MFPWIKYDLQSLRIFKRFGKKFLDDMANGRYIIDIFEETAAKQGRNPMIIFEDREYSWDFMNEQANRVANIVLQWGLKVGDVVAIFVENSPEFVWLMLGNYYSPAVETKGDSVFPCLSIYQSVSLSSIDQSAHIFHYVCPIFNMIQSIYKYMAW